MMLGGGRSVEGNRSRTGHNAPGPFVASAEGKGTSKKAATKRAPKPKTAPKPKSKSKSRGKARSTRG
jgi:hypothetical protein